MGDGASGGAEERASRGGASGGAEEEVGAVYDDEEMEGRRIREHICSAIVL